MKKYLLVALVLALGFLTYSISGVLLAQVEEEMEYSWGTVSKVSPNQIVVREYDENGEEVDVSYVINPDVVLENVDSLESIAVGDSVDIEYVIKNNEKIAKIIIVEKASYEEELPSEI